MQTTHSIRLTQCLADSGINTPLLCAYLQQSIQRPTDKNLKNAIHYRMQVVQVERLIFLIAL